MDQNRVKQRGRDLNLRPPGYEPAELLLLYPADCEMALR